MIQETSEEITYTTRVRNERLFPANLYANGRVLKTLVPGEVTTIESVNPLSIYARYEEVIFRGRGQVKLVQRSNWIEPDRGPFVLECINLEGKDCEERFLGCQNIQLPRHVPVLVGHNDDRLSQYDRLEIKQVQRKKPSSEFYGYVVYRWAIEDVYHER